MTWPVRLGLPHPPENQHLHPIHVDLDHQWQRKYVAIAQWKVIVCSLLNFHIDEFIEVLVPQEHSESIGHLTSVARRLCAPQRLDAAIPLAKQGNAKKSNGYHNGDKISNNNRKEPGGDADEAARDLEDKLV